MQSEQTFLNPFATAQTTSTRTKIQLKIEILVGHNCLNSQLSSIFLNSMNYADP